MTALSVHLILSVNALLEYLDLLQFYFKLSVFIY